MRYVNRLSLPLFCALLFPLAASGGEVLKKTTTGKLKLKSINVISFAPQGVLLIGDGAGSQIIAVQTGDTSPQPRLAKKIDAQNKRRGGKKPGFSTSWRH